MDEGLAFSIRYVVEGDDDYFAVDWSWEEEGKWSVSCKEYGLGHRWEKWGTLDKNQSSYIYKKAYQALLKEFGLEEIKDDFPLEKIVSMSPSELASVGERNPGSYTLGDHRDASQVR